MLKWFDVEVNLYSFVVTMQKPGGFISGLEMTNSLQVESFFCEANEEKVKFFIMLSHLCCYSFC